MPILLTSMGTSTPTTCATSATTDGPVTLLMHWCDDAVSVTMLGLSDDAVMLVSMACISSVGTRLVTPVFRPEHASAPSWWEQLGHGSTHGQS